jgi:hypothetical protein
MKHELVFRAMHALQLLTTALMAQDKAISHYYIYFKRTSKRHYLIADAIWRNNASPSLLPLQSEYISIAVCHEGITILYGRESSQISYRFGNGESLESWIIRVSRRIAIAIDIEREDELNKESES